ncbi:MAG: proline iminopeptidase-family hydrolase [Cryomorphaceae bacterium]|nr:proline iminopeptidase-family hydrolase [Cryomorphaceae bacterium]
MWYEKNIDNTINVSVDGYTVKVYSFGTGDETLLCLNGGPGLPCDYIRDCHSWISNKGYKVIAYDQLGCGLSDKPKDKQLWNVKRYANELNTIIEALNLKNIHLLGQSWGTILGLEYVVTYPNVVKSMIMDNGVSDVPHLISELNRLREALGSETVKMMLRHEAEGTLDHPEYQAAITILNYRHVCRLDEWPESIHASLNDWNMDVYETMQGPNEFLYIGNLKEWNRINEMKDVRTNTLITVGMHDELPPSCALKMNNALSNSIIKVFKNSSHMPFYEEPNKYFKTLINFIR